MDHTEFDPRVYLRENYIVGSKYHYQILSFTNSDSIIYLTKDGE